MRARFLITPTDPDHVDADAWNDTLELCEVFRSERAARKALASRARRTNAHRVHLLKIELVDSARGTLLDDMEDE
jgi:hypothetical protein